MRSDSEIMKDGRRPEYVLAEILLDIRRELVSTKGLILEYMGKPREVPEVVKEKWYQKLFKGVLCVRQRIYLTVGQLKMYLFLKSSLIYARISKRF